ncbi:MAG: alpha-L-fucosidase [Oscillospiraceae bacterium]|jgi:alpha-L-fucosidase|nr:alpha-L-fucosidase [Oscillospiraceae bacterium]
MKKRTQRALTLAVAASLALAASVAVFVRRHAGGGYYEKPERKYPAGDYGFSLGYGTNNNGFPKDSAEVRRLVSVTPSQKQLDYLEMEYYSFIHFGMNTMTDVEWGTGKESPSQFNPEKLDTNQWCEALKASGSKGIILTAKHHDGFCLWPSAYTEHSIRNSPYKNGAGDIVKELADSCKKYGLKFGIYLSPWDMHEPSYGKAAYHDFFVNQLRELMNPERYGEIFCVWFDGARGEDAVVDPDFAYDFARYYAVIKELQPNAVTAVSGEDVRWVGNEAGVARESEWSVVSRGNAATQKFQQNAKDGEELKGVVYDAEDTGSRALLENYQDLIFKPAEVDVSIRPGWFYHEDQKPKSLEHLLRIYYKAVGGNSSLLLNVPPNKDGLIAEKDVRRLAELGRALRKSTETPVAVTAITAGDAKQMQPDDRLRALLQEQGESYELGPDRYIVDFQFGEKKRIGRIDLREDLRFSQRVELFEFWAKTSAGWVLLSDSTVIGNRKIIMLNGARSTDCIRLIIKQSRGNPHLRWVGFYEK